MRPEERFAGGRILLVVAHPDDETIGAGGQLRLWAGRLHFLYATDGAPWDMTDALRAGFADRVEYLKARRRELAGALSEAGLGLESCTFVELVDQECYLYLLELSRAVANAVHSFRPDWVITHAYEGGHPDHDSCAFACAAARAPGLHEFPAYRAGPNGWILGEFIDDRGEVFASELNGEQRELKRRMLACYESQREVLRHFGVDREVFREAPAYDFTAPPHEGPLHYESLGWAVDGAAWRRAAQATYAAYRP